MTRAQSARGLQRERDLRPLLAADGWLAVRVAKGPVDLVVMRAIVSVPVASEVRLVQVKSSAPGPFHSFGPAERQQLLDLAQQAGATAWLIWWPPHGQWRWIPHTAWPSLVRKGPGRINGQVVNRPVRNVTQPEE